MILSWKHFKFHPNICNFQIFFNWLSDCFSAPFLCDGSPSPALCGVAMETSQIVGKISISRTPILMPNSFFLLLMCFISMLNIAKTYAYIICKPIQSHSVFQRLSQCLSFSILICSSLIWDHQSICFVPPLMGHFKRNMSSVQVSSLSRFCHRNKHSFCILVILAHIMTQSLSGCYIGGFILCKWQACSLTNGVTSGERCSGNEGKWWGNPLTFVQPVTAWNPSTKQLCQSV